MRLRTLFVPFLLAATLLACGGNGVSDTPVARGRPAPQFAPLRGNIVVFSGVRVQYKVTAVGSGYTVTDLTGVKPPVTVGANDRLRFADTTIALDLNGAAGQAYRLYQAAFNRTPDAVGLTYWIEALDRGAKLTDVASAFISSAEFIQLYGSNPNNRDLVVRLYFNILRRGPDPGGLAFWQDILDQRKSDLANVLIGFSESQENQNGVKALIPNGIPIVESGVSYAPPGAALAIINGGNRPVSVLDLINFDGSASVLASGRLPVYSWTFDSVPVGSLSTLQRANTARPSFVPDQPGNYVVRLTVGDGRQVSHASTATINAIRGTAISSSNGGISSKINYVYLNSDPGDPIAEGGRYSYIQANSRLRISYQRNTLLVEVAGDETWSGYFALPGSFARPTAGSYTNLGEYFNRPRDAAGLHWLSDDDRCNTLTGNFVIENITYVDDAISSLDMTFDQNCILDNTTLPGLHGRIHWVPDDNSVPPGPITPVPQGLWRPSGSLPATGNYVILDSQAGDTVGNGNSYTLPEAQNTTKISATNNRLSFQVGNNGEWTGEFQIMNVISILQPGYYGSLQRYNNHNLVKGGFYWDGIGAKCNKSNSWVAIDNIKFNGANLSELDLRFEQHCEGNTPALRGLIHWTAAQAIPTGP